MSNRASTKWQQRIVNDRAAAGRYEGRRKAERLREERELKRRIEG